MSNRKRMSPLINYVPNGTCKNALNVQQIHFSTLSDYVCPTTLIARLSILKKWYARLVMQVMILLKISSILTKLIVSLIKHKTIILSALNSRTINALNVQQIHFSILLDYACPTTLTAKLSILKN
jgi:hypothetical protein